MVTVNLLQRDLEKRNSSTLFGCPVGLQQSFGDSVNATGFIDHKLQPANNKNTAKIKICKIEI